MIALTARAEEITHSNCKLNIGYKVYSKEVLEILKDKGFEVSAFSDPSESAQLGELVLEYQQIPQKGAERGYEIEIEVKMSLSTFRSVARVSEKEEDLKKAFLKTMRGIPKCKGMNR